MAPANLLIGALMIAGFILSIYSQQKIVSTYNEYGQINNRNNYTGADVAKLLLERNGVTDVEVTRIEGQLTDHYDPTNKVLRLSENVYGSTSIAAASVAAHETGHALQHATGYTPLSIRTKIFPIASIGTNAGITLFFLGMVLSFPILRTIGVVLFGAYILFSLVTLPVEFDASKRGLNLLEENGILEVDEIEGGKKVLGAAALTYVAASLGALIQFLNLITLSKRDRK